MIYITLILAFLSIGALVLSFFLKNERTNSAKTFSRVASVVVFIVALVTLGFSSATAISAGHVGIPVLFGSVQNYTFNEGFHFVNPFISVTQMSVRTQTYEMGGAQDTNAPGEHAPGNRTDDAVSVITRDQLSVTMEVSVQFHLNASHSEIVYRLFGEDYANNVVHPIVRAAVRDAASEFTTIELVDQRPRLQSRMEDLVEGRLRNTLHGRQVPNTAIIIDNILLRNMDLPDTLDEAIANVQRQHQETAARRQALETARAEAERVRVEAEGQAQATLTNARAQAEANRVLSQSITQDLLKLRAIDATREITTNPNSRLVILGSGNQQTPLIMNMGQEQN